MSAFDPKRTLAEPQPDHFQPASLTRYDVTPQSRRGNETARVQGRAPVQVPQQLTWSEATNLQIDIRSSEADRRSEHDLCGISVPKAAAAGPRQRDGIRGGGRGRPHRATAR